MTQNKKVRWAILGAGNIAKAFVLDFPFMQNAELVAVAARNKSKAQQFAIEHLIPQAMDYEELYHSREIDAVYIATTHNFHLEHSLQCIRSGKAVLCEKPVTVNDRQFRELAAAARENKVFLMEAMWTWFLPAITRAREWVQQGRIGELKVIQADFSFPSEFKPEGRLYNPQLAGGALLDIGIYPIAFTDFFMGRKPDSITASGSLTSTGVDERVGILLEYGDVSATLYASIVTRMNNKACLFGTGGRIEIPEFWKAGKAGLYNDEGQLVEEFRDDRVSRGFIFEMQHANDRILAGKTESEVVSFEASNRIQEIMKTVRDQIGLRYPFEDA